MKTVGQIIKLARQEQKLELSDISRVTRIRPHFLEAIENDDFASLPSSAVAKGFIRNYSESLGLKPDYILAVFRRDFSENRQGQIVPRAVSQPVISNSYWTPKTTIIAIVVCVFILFGVYLFYQYRILKGPPMLRVMSPSSNVSTSETTIKVSGQTDPDATLSVNQELVALEKNGYFSFRIVLHQGVNIISITATSKSKNSTTVTRKVMLTSPE